jgi:hypothetical protein
VITCSRCGKENQDLYKFCLGCGAKLQTAPAPGPAPRPVAPAEALPPTPPPEFGSDSISVAKTAVPPEPVSFSPVGPTIASPGPALVLCRANPSP